jgi:hypothetical protein
MDVVPSLLLWAGRSRRQRERLLAAEHGSADGAATASALLTLRRIPYCRIFRWIVPCQSLCGRRRIRPPRQVRPADSSCRGNDEAKCCFVG